MHLKQYMGDKHYDPHNDQFFTMLAYMVMDNAENEKELGIITFTCYEENMPVMCNVTAFETDMVSFSTLRKAMYQLAVKILRDTLGYTWVCTLTPFENVKFAKLMSSKVMEPKQVLFGKMLLLGSLKGLK
jgi:hypothetical protein